MVGMFGSVQVLRPRVVGDAIYLEKSTLLAQRVGRNGLWNLDRPKPAAAAKLLSLAYGKCISVGDGMMELYEQACQALLRNPNEAERLLANLKPPAGEIGDGLEKALRLMKSGVAPDQLETTLRREPLGLKATPGWAESLTLCEDGVVLGEGTVIAPLTELSTGGTGLEIEGREAGILTLLSIARADLAPPQVLEKLVSASRALARGNTAQAAITLCQLGQPPLQDRALAKSLAFAAYRLSLGQYPGDLMKAHGLLDSANALDAWMKGGGNPNHVPGGCSEGGQFCSAEDMIASSLLNDPNNKDAPPPPAPFASWDAYNRHMAGVQARRQEQNEKDSIDPNKSNINWDAIASIENGGDSKPKLNGYIPDDKNGHSGVTVATGFDIGQHSEQDLRNMGLPEPLITKLKPYCAPGPGQFLYGDAAKSALDKKALTINETEARLIDIGAKKETYENLVNAYNDSATESGGVKFNDLPPRAQTAIASLYFQYRDKVTTNKNIKPIWQAYLNQDWSAAYSALKNAKDGFTTRRGKEANILFGLTGK